MGFYFDGPNGVFMEGGLTRGPDANQEVSHSRYKGILCVQISVSSYVGCTL